MNDDLVGNRDGVAVKDFEWWDELLRQVSVNVPFPWIEYILGGDVLTRLLKELVGDIPSLI